MDPVSAFGKIPAVFVHLKADLPLDLHHVVHNGLHVHIVAELHAQTSAQTEPSLNTFSTKAFSATMLLPGL